MPINFSIDLSARRRAQEQQAALDKLRQSLIGQQEAGPPTQFGQGSWTGGLLEPTPQAQFVSQLLQPETMQTGIQEALKLLEQQRQMQLAQTQLPQIQEALAAIPQTTPELRALTALAGSPLGGKEVMGGLIEQLQPFTLSTGQQRFTGTGESIAIGPEKAADLEAKRQKMFTQATQLRGEFTGITKPFEDQNQAYGRIIASAADPSAAGDLALIFNYMKLLDPGSTVREGEFATAVQAGSVPSIIMAQYNKILTGERLTVEQRQDFVDRSSRLFEQAATQHKKTAEEFRALARKNDLDPADVVFNRQTVDVTRVPIGKIPPPPPGFVMESK